MEQNKKIGFFEESTKSGVTKLSFGRLASAYLLVLGGFTVVFPVLKGIAVDYMSMYFLIGTAVAGKVIQKSQEK